MNLLHRSAEDIIRIIKDANHTKISEWNELTIGITVLLYHAKKVPSYSYSKKARISVVNVNHCNLCLSRKFHTKRNIFEICFILIFVSVRNLESLSNRSLIAGSFQNDLLGRKTLVC